MKTLRGKPGEIMEMLELKSDLSQVQMQGGSQTE